MSGEPYGTTLRAVGWFLDVERGRRIRIEELDTELQVHWQALDGGTWLRAFDASALAAFHRLARQGRASPEDAVTGVYAELLRTLGQELDQRAFTRVQIRESGGFRVEGQVAGSPLTAWYDRDELRKLSEERHTTRQPPPRPSRWWPF
jgi:hypothetical protein